MDNTRPIGRSEGHSASLQFQPGLTCCGIVLAIICLAAWSCNASDVFGKHGEPTALSVVWHTQTEASYIKNWLGGRPALDNGLLFVEDGNRVIALDAATGTLRWGRPVRVNPVPAARALLARDGRVFVAEIDSVIAMSQSDGHTLWQFRPDSASVVFPSVDDRAFYTGQWNIPVVYALGVADGHLMWRVNVGAGWGFQGYVEGTALSGDTVYVAATRWLAVNGALSTAVIVALDRTDGHELWRYETPTNRNSMVTTPVVAGRYLIASDFQGHRFFAVDRFTQKQVWEVPSAGSNGPIGPAAVVGSHVYVASADAYLYAADLTAGTLEWQQFTGSSIFGNAEYCAGSVFINNGSLERRDPNAGGRLTGYVHADSKNLFTSGLISDGTHIFFTGYDGVYSVACNP